jgi:hypothetical protein
MKPLFRIVVCELFHPLIFGKDENSDKNIDGHFLVINSYTRNYSYTIDDNEEDDEEDDEEEEEEEDYPEYEGEGIPLYDNNIFEIVEKDISQLKSRNHPMFNHPSVRNYNKIVKQCLRFEIAHCITLSGGECIAILKTFWIKVIIRTYKKAYKKKIWSMYQHRLNGNRGSYKSILRGLLA